MLYANTRCVYWRNALPWARSRRSFSLAFLFAVDRASFCTQNHSWWQLEFSMLMQVSLSLSLLNYCWCSQSQNPGAPLHCSSDKSPRHTSRAPVARRPPSKWSVLCTWNESCTRSRSSGATTALDPVPTAVLKLPHVPFQHVFHVTPTLFAVPCMYMYVNMQQVFSVLLPVSFGYTVSGRPVDDQNGAGEQKKTRQAARHCKSAWESGEAGDSSGLQLLRRTSSMALNVGV